MFFDILLVTLCIGSAVTIWYHLSLKIPELVAVPDEVIVERLHEDSAKISIFLLQFKTFLREGHYRIWLWKFCEKIFYRLHILFLRVDNSTVALLQKIRTVGGMSSNGINSSGIGAGNGVSNGNSQEAGANAEYWLKIREGQERKAVQIQTVSSTTRTARPKTSRIQEVRTKKNEKTPG